MRAWLASLSYRSAGLLNVPPNSALLTDTYTSPLRAQRGAAKRER
jgi:hypothetical protein